jgi:hypothetical protein
MRSLFEDEEQPGEVRGRLLASLEDYIQFVSNDFSYDDYVQRMIREQLNQVVALDGFLKHRC